MIDWKSARETRRRLEPHLDSPEDTLMHLALDGVSTRASEWTMGGNTVWRMDGNILKWAHEETADEDNSAKVAKVRKLRTRFWEAMRTAAEHVDWQLGYFSHSTSGIYSRDGVCLVEPDQRVIWAASGVEFSWDQIVNRLRLKKPPKGRSASNDEFTKWFTDESRVDWNPQFRPTARKVRERFQEFDEFSNLSLNEDQVETVRDAYGHLKTAPRGRPKSSARRGPGPQ